MEHVFPLHLITFDYNRSSIETWPRALTRILKTGVPEPSLPKSGSQSNHTKEYSLLQKTAVPAPKMGVQQCKSAVSESSVTDQFWWFIMKSPIIKQHLRMQWPCDRCQKCVRHVQVWLHQLRNCVILIIDNKDIHGQHKSMTFSRRWCSRGEVPTSDKNFHQRFFFRQYCRQINIFWAKFIIYLHFVTMETTSTNPGRLITSLNPPIRWITWFGVSFGKQVCRMYPQCSNQIGQYAIVIPPIVRYCFSIF